MPRFLLPIFILGLISSAGLGSVVLRMGPEQTVSVVLFLATFFFSTTAVLSLTFFFVRKKFFFKPKTFAALGPVVIADDLRPLFRTSLRNAVVISVIATVLLVLRRLT